MFNQVFSKYCLWPKGRFSKIRSHIIGKKTVENLMLEVLVSFSGSDLVPSLGFNTKAVLHFSSDCMYPNASTCRLILTLPTKHSEHTDFISAMIYGFRYEKFECSWLRNKASMVGFYTVITLAIYMYIKLAAEITPTKQIYISNLKQIAPTNPEIRASKVLK